MQIIKLATLIYLLSFTARSMAAIVEIFGQHIEIKDKYRLEASASLSASKIIFRTGNFLRGSSNGKLEIITIGTLESYLQENEINDISEIAEKILKGNNYNEAILNKQKLDVGGEIYYQKLFFDNSNFIYYLVQDLNDVTIDVGT